MLDLLGWTCNLFIRRDFVVRSLLIYIYIYTLANIYLTLYNPLTYTLPDTFPQILVLTDTVTYTPTYHHHHHLVHLHRSLILVVMDCDHLHHKLHLTLILETPQSPPQTPPYLNLGGDGVLLCEVCVVDRGLLQLGTERLVLVVHRQKT